MLRRHSRHARVCVCGSGAALALVLLLAFSSAAQATHRHVFPAQRVSGHVAKFVIRGVQPEGVVAARLHTPRGRRALNVAAVRRGVERGAVRVGVATASSRLVLLTRRDRGKKKRTSGARTGSRARGDAGVGAHTRRPHRRPSPRPRSTRRRSPQRASEPASPSADRAACSPIPRKASLPRPVGDPSAPTHRSTARCPRRLG